MTGLSVLPGARVCQATMKRMGHIIFLLLLILTKSQTAIGLTDDLPMFEDTLTNPDANSDPLWHPVTKSQRHSNDQEHHHHHYDDDEHVHHHHHESHLDAVHYFTAVMVITFLLIISGFGIALPNLIQRTARKQRPEDTDLRLLVESFCTAFAAGGFWGLAIIHVLFESVAACDSLRFGFHVNSNFMNAAYPLTVLGYMLMLGIEAFSSTHQAKRRTLNADDQTNKLGAQSDAIISCIALGFHAFFEGLIVGMRHDPMVMWIAAISVGGHKWAEAFALSQRMTNKDVPSSLRRLLLSAFIGTTPFGILLGLLLGSHEESIANGIINSISSGVLVYVAGHCTADVFGHGHDHEHGHDHDHHDHHHNHDVGDPSAFDHKSHSRQESDTQPLNPSSTAYGDDHSHDTTCSYNKDPTRCRNLEASYTVFLGRIVLMSLGVGMVLGLMIVHLATPGHVH